MYSSIFNPTNIFQRPQIQITPDRQHLRTAVCSESTSNDAIIEKTVKRYNTRQSSAAESVPSSKLSPSAIKSISESRKSDVSTKNKRQFDNESELSSDADEYGLSKSDDSSEGGNASEETEWEADESSHGHDDISEELQYELDAEDNVSESEVVSDSTLSDSVDSVVNRTDGGGKGNKSLSSTLARHVSISSLKKVAPRANKRTTTDVFWGDDVDLDDLVNPDRAKKDKVIHPENLNLPQPDDCGVIEELDSDDSIEEIPDPALLQLSFVDEAAQRELDLVEHFVPESAEALTARL